MTEIQRITRSLHNRLVQKAIHLPRSLLLLIVQIVFNILTETPHKAAQITLVEYRKQAPDERTLRVLPVLAERYGLRRMREGHLRVRFIRCKPATNAELAILYDLKMRARAAGDADMVAVVEKAIYALRG